MDGILKMLVDIKMRINELITRFFLEAEGAIFVFEMRVYI